LAYGTQVPKHLAHSISDRTGQGLSSKIGLELFVKQKLERAQSGHFFGKAQLQFFLNFNIAALKFNVQGSMLRSNNNVEIQS
jgi:hypothetical protein